MLNLRLLKDAIIGKQRIVLIQLNSIYYVDYDDNRYSAKDIFLRKNHHGMVYSFLEDALKQFDFYHQKLMKEV